MMYFGPAGTPESFKAMGYRKSEQLPEYLERFGLNAFEYQCGRGVRISDEAARALRGKFAEKGIRISLHAPYYISMSSLDEEKRLGSIRYILESARAVTALGGERIVIHAGSTAKMPREQALELAIDTFRLAIRALDEAGYAHVVPCPEVMGKIGQLGTLEEVLAMCRVDERMLPCVDFGHLYARSLGVLTGKEACIQMLDRMAQILGEERASKFHSHFSHIEFTPNGGEKCHRTFAEDDGFGPDWLPLAEEIARRDWSPTFICESAGTQAEDAKTMKEVYLAAKER